MTYVVAEPCVNCRYTDCALVCPVEAFHLDDDMLHINPETCIDCDACVPECPVEAVSRKQMFRPSGPILRR
jgi:ferredoxin